MRTPKLLLTLGILLVGLSVFNTAQGQTTPPLTAKDSLKLLKKQLKDKIKTNEQALAVQKKMLRQVKISLNPNLKSPVPGQTIHLEFNEKGQMISTPPPMITSQDKITFQLTTSKEFSENRILQTYKLFQQTLNQLNLVDATQNNLALKTLGLQNVDDAKNLIDITKMKLAELLKGMWLKHEAVLKTQLDKPRETKALEAFITTGIQDVETTTYSKMIFLPDPEKISNPGYTVDCRVVNSNGLNVATSCNKPIKLESRCSECANTFSGDLNLGDIKEGPVRLTFELRMDNHVQSELTDLVAADADASAYFQRNDIYKIKKDLTNLLNFSNLVGVGITTADVTALNKWLAEKEQPPAAKEADGKSQKQQVCPRRPWHLPH